MDNDKILRGAAPVYDVYYPTDVWTEVLPNLYLGGTHSHEDMMRTEGESVFEEFGVRDPEITKDKFDTVITLYAWARPADWFVKELRYGMLDGEIADLDLGEIKTLVTLAHADWKAGKRVLIRCQAGINRSSLVAALLLIRDGYSARRAIDQLRRTRGGAVLANRHFNDWLLQVDVRRWRG